jgi:hypothetical protein
MLPFVLFCEARTGSTTLMRIFNLHAEIHCLDEPFNHDYSPAYAGRVTGTESLDQVLAEIWQTHNGIKHVADPSGWPFKETGLNHNLLLNPGHDLILLTRRNRLRRAVSVEIARQTGVWQPWNEEDRNRSWLFKYSPIPTARLRTRLDADAHFLEDVNSDVRIRAGRSFALDYDDLFGDTHNQTIAIVNKMIAFLGLDAFQPATVSKILEILDLNTSVTASDSQNLYRLIPNIDQIEAELGSAETGWLFKELEFRKDGN